MAAGAPRLIFLSLCELVQGGTGIYFFLLLRSSIVTEQPVEVHSLNIGGGKIMKTMTNDVCCSPSLSTMHFHDI